MAMPRAGSSQLLAMIPDADAELLAETLVAFANADGGTVYVGVGEDGRPSGALFIEEFDEVVHYAESLCRPPVPVAWEQIETGGVFIFAGYVRRSSGLHTLSDGRVLVRTGVENRLLAGDQVTQLASTRSVGEYEAEPVPGTTVAELDNTTIQGFLDAWGERQGRAFDRSFNDLMQEMGWILPDGRLTVAGLLLFGKAPQSFIPRSGLIFVRFDGSRTRRADGSPGYGRRVEVQGPLPVIIRRTWEILQEEIQVGAVVKGLERKEQWLYPPSAIREALVNAVAHRDYRLRGRAIEVRMFADRLEISSPGGLPGFITVDNIVDEHFSRNPRLVNGLFQWGYIEELGLGVDLMIEEMVNAGHSPPDFRDTEASFTVIFHSAQERRKFIPPRGVEMDSMNERQAKALAYVQQNKRITNREYKDLCPDVSSETLRLDLSDLVDRGILLKVGAKRGTYYILK